MLVDLTDHDAAFVTDSATWRGVRAERVLADALVLLAIEQAGYLVRVGRGDPDVIAALEDRRAEIVRDAFEERAAPVGRDLLG